MITHFAELELQTVSINGVKQVYADRLGFPIQNEDGHSVTFALTAHTTLTFVERFKAVAPAHFAFQVAYHSFSDAVQILKDAGILIVSDVRDTEFQRQLYFRDGDGNLLEVIAFDYIPQNVLPTHSPLNILYLREVGFPVKHVETCRKWMDSALGLVQSQNSSAQFGFMVGGTAHNVVVDQTRPWIPIAMRALPPAMKLIWGTPSLAYLEQTRKHLVAQGVNLKQDCETLAFELEGYRLELRHTPDFSADIPEHLNLPKLLDH